MIQTQKEYDSEDEISEQSSVQMYTNLLKNVEVPSKLNLPKRQNVKKLNKVRNAYISGTNKGKKPNKINKTITTLAMQARNEDPQLDEAFDQKSHKLRESRNEPLLLKGFSQIQTPVNKYLPSEDYLGIHTSKQKKGGTSTGQFEHLQISSQMQSQKQNQQGIMSIVSQRKKDRKKSMYQGEALDEVQDLLSSNKPKNQEKGKNKELELVKEILSGKVSIIWIFVLCQNLRQSDRSRIRKMYQGLSSNKHVVPLCKDISQVKPFLKIPNSLFKIVSDLENMGDIIKLKKEKHVVEIYIYNEKKQKGVNEALSYKSQTRKVKGIFIKLDKIIDRAEDEIEYEIQLFESKAGISQRKKVKIFPTFMKLSGQDKTYATLYRANLYGAKNLEEEEKQQAYQNFIDFVIEKYGKDEKEKPNIMDYQKINHFTNVYDLDKATKIISFYVRQSFYYQILNSMLRTMKTTEEFKPCILPFNQTYHAIKMFYAQDLIRSTRNVRKQTLYRGAQLRKRDFQGLKPNVFIQMLGFMSTSKNLERAKQFTDSQGYIFVIHVPELNIPKKYDRFDHGFVDINKHNLAGKKFEIQEEVLFNALNVYKILEIEKSTDGYTYIHIEYGVIFQLLKKKKKNMTDDEKDILMNYEYCSQLLNEIQDQGDVYLLANQFEDSKNYYQSKILQNQEEVSKAGKYYYKLANVQQQCGQLDEADFNVRTSLKLQLEELDISDRERCLKVFSIHSKNAEISLEKQDYLNADEAINYAIELIPPDKEFELGKKLRERGDIKFKKGQVEAAEGDFNESENILKSLSAKAEKKRSKIQRDYVFSFLTLWCSSTTKEDIDRDKEIKMRQIDDFEDEINNMEERINEQLIKVNNSLKEVAFYAEDKQKYEVCVKKGRAYLLEIESRKTNDPYEKARLKAMEAIVQDYLDLVESEKLLTQAIKLIESNEPYHLQVGKISTILAQLQKQELEKFSNPKCVKKNKLVKNSEKITFQQNKHNSLVEKCRKNYQKAINVLLYNSKTHSSPEVMSLKNELGELDYNQSNYERSEKIILEVKAAKTKTQHSQIAKSCLLLSKIAYARGELKYSFQNITQAKSSLKKAYVKKKQTDYYKIYQSSELYLQIKMHRSKVYLKQLKHDQSLKDLDVIEKIISFRLSKTDSHSLLADIQEIKGQNEVAQEKFNDFDDYFRKAIKLREKQMGSYNLPNAITYCNYSKYLCMVNDFEEAEEALEKASQIFSCFAEDHPITWIINYCYGVYNEKKNNPVQALVMLESCMQKAKKKFDSSHITLNKIRFQYSKALHRSGRVEEAINEFESLETDLNNELRESHSRNNLLEEIDDEKINLKVSVYSSLRDSYRVVEALNDDFLLKSKHGINRCEKGMDNLKMSYKFFN